MEILDILLHVSHDSQAVNHAGCNVATYLNENFLVMYQPGINQLFLACKNCPALVKLVVIVNWLTVLLAVDYEPC